MKQKLGLACALIRTPRLLLLDEPSVGVDPISRRELWQMVYKLVDQGIGVVWSTAYLDEAQRCGMVLLLNEGQSLYNGPPQQLTSRLEGRSFLVHNLGAERRTVLARAVTLPDVVDGVMQGSSIRLVIAAGKSPPGAAELGVSAAEVVPTPPRFEDAFVDLVGGAPKGQSALAGAALAVGHVRGRCRSARADQEVRRFHGRRSNLVPHRPRRNFWTAGAKRSRQVDHLQNDVRPAAAHGRLGPRGRHRSLSFGRRRAAAAWATWLRSFRSMAISACGRIWISSPVCMASRAASEQPPRSP